MSGCEDEPVRYERSATPVDITTSLLPHLDLHSPGLGSVLRAKSTANSGNSLEEFLRGLTTGVAQVVAGPARGQPASAPGGSRVAGGEVRQEEECEDTEHQHVLLVTALPLDHNWAQLPDL